MPTTTEPGSVALAWAKQTVLIKQFLETNPDANIVVEAWDIQKLSEEKLFIADKCGRLLTGPSYTFLQASGAQEKLFVWFDSNQNAACVAVDSNQSAARSGGAKTIEIKNVFITGITDTNAVVSWLTKTKAPSVVFFGTDQNGLDQHAQADGNTLTHSVSLGNLSPKTKYFVAIATDSSDSNNSLSAGAFTTKRDPREPFANGSISIEALRPDRQSPDSTVLTWKTDTQSVSAVFFGESPDLLDQTALNTTPARIHNVSLENLKFGKKYYYRAYATDG
ncbi:MAG: fibronectin type III domain-containing protein, partial [Candidatus Diapherotrites archaeon]|nr:fibronectin type III domain-containing protein [Candidatus Diapherotrites archaeon]